MADIYVADRSAVLYHEGRRVRLVKDVTTVEAGHPLLEGRDELFKPQQVDYPAASGGESNKPTAEPSRDTEGDDDGEELPDGVKHLGSGWYEVDGAKVRGRDAAVERAEAADDDGEGADGE